MGYLDNRFGIAISANFGPVSAYNNPPGLVGGTPASGGTFGVFGMASGAGADTVRYMIANKPDQVRQNVGIEAVEIAIDNLTNVSAIWFELWRRFDADDPTYTRAYEGANIVPSLTAGAVNTVTGIVGANAEEGDVIVMGLTRTTNGACTPFVADTGATIAHTFANIYEFRSDTSPSSEFNWLVQTQIPGTILPVKLIGQTSEFICTGDSIVGGPYQSGGRYHVGYSVNNSGAADFAAEHRQTTFTYLLAEELGLTRYQNLGQNSQNTAVINARFAQDLADTLPRFAILEGGRNDLNGGRTQAAFLADVQSMFQTCQDNAVKVVFLGIPPATSDTDIMAADRRAWNAAVQGVVGGYNNIVYMDTDAVLGQTRGSTGQLDDLNTAYNGGDSLPHPNVAGHAALATAIAAVVRANNFQL